MFKAIPLMALLFSSIGGMFFNCSKLSKYSAIFSFLFFAFEFFLPNGLETVEWFSKGFLSFKFSMNFANTELIICSVVCSILICLRIAKGDSQDDKELNMKFGLIDLFVFFMCLAVLSNDMFQFFIGIESMGLISAAFVSIEKKSLESSVRTLAFNKFASLTFLIGIFLISAYTNSFDFSVVKRYCLENGNSALFLPACLILISCLCKGAQFPFSYWLLEATKANVFASIIIHSATIVAVGILFVTKCYFLFEAFPSLKEAMAFFGAFTAVWMSFKALFYNNIKKIIACLTCCSSGIMFISCGMGEYSLTIIYFICHAFCKSVLFLSFYYVMRAMSGEWNILRMGKLNNIIPRIKNVLLVSFAAFVGIPFFSKVFFASAVRVSGKLFLEIAGIISNAVSIVAVLRAILISMYGESRANEATLIKAKKFDSKSMISFWMLLGFSIFGSIICCILYKRGELSFCYKGTIPVLEWSDYLIESATIIVAVVIALFFIKQSAPKNENNFLYEALLRLSKNSLLFIFGFLNKKNEALYKLFNYKSFRGIYTAGNIIRDEYNKSLCSHLIWILVGIILSLFCYIVWELN